MSLEIAVIKSANGMLMPADAESANALQGIKAGKTLKGKFTQMRNYLFHKKWFSLVGFAYDHWTPGELDSARWEGVTPEKNFERFRKDLTILAGFYEASYRLDGSVRIEAKSVSFASMNQDEFDRLYSATINAVLKHVLTNYDRAGLDAVVEQLMRYDG